MSEQWDRSGEERSPNDAPRTPGYDMDGDEEEDEDTRGPSDPQESSPSSQGCHGHQERRAPPACQRAGEAGSSAGGGGSGGPGGRRDGIYVMPNTGLWLGSGPPVTIPVVVPQGEILPWAARYQVSREFRSLKHLMLNNLCHCEKPVMTWKRSHVMVCHEMPWCN